VHLPVHPVWFWLLVFAPYLSLLILWGAANIFNLSLKPLARWLWAGYFLFFVPDLLLGGGAVDGHKTQRLVIASCAYSCFGMALWIKRHYLFETLPAPGAKWYFPWKAAGFSIPAGTRILVRNIDAVSPWYIDKLGMSRLSENNCDESGIATFRFKADGNSVVLTTRGGFGTGKTAILFTTKITRMRDVMAARGVEVGTIEKDRQGIRYFEIHDPEGNEIEVVEET
jgi:predicted enzyme related to lactoylglutathione lyase